MAGIPLNPSEPNLPDQAGSRQYTTALIALAVLYFMMGFITCLNDTLVPFFKKGFVLTYSQSSLVQFYFFLTYGLMSVPAGKIVEKAGYKNGMVLGFLIAAFGGLLFLPAAGFHQYSLFLAALFVLAIGIVLLQVAANPYITLLGPARTASSRLTLIQGVGSAGTTLAPLFGAYFILDPLEHSGASSDAVKLPYLGITAVLLIIAFIVYRSALPSIRQHTEASLPTEEKGGLFRFRNLNLGILGIFAYVGAEVAIGTFLTNYIADTLAVAESQANGYVSYYWGGMLVGRFVGFWGLKKWKPAHVLSLCALGAIALILTSITSDGALAVWTMIATGLCNSVMFAIIFSLATEGIGNYRTQASGLLSSAIAGGALVSYTQGLLIDHYNWQVAFGLPLVCYGYILFYGLNGHKSTQNHLLSL